jgi:hypothetical protein
MAANNNNNNVGRVIFDNTTWVHLGAYLSLRDYFFCLSTRFPMLYYNCSEIGHAIATRVVMEDSIITYNVVAYSEHSDSARGKRVSSVHRLYNKAITYMKQHPEEYITPPHEREIPGWYIAYSQADPSKKGMKIVKDGYITNDY